MTLAIFIMFMMKLIKQHFILKYVQERKGCYLFSFKYLCTMGIILDILVDRDLLNSVFANLGGDHRIVKMLKMLVFHSFKSI